MSFQDLLLLSAQIVLLIAAAAVLGKAAKYIGLPKITGELSAGILLGPTLLGHFWPETSNFFFPAGSPTIHVREMIVHTGLLFFLLSAGMELQPEYLKKNARTVAVCSILGMIIPFTLGWLFVIYFPGILETGPDNTRFMAFFLGTALSISALPVIAKILIDLKLMQTRFGTLVMSAAAIDDLAGWILFSALLTAFQGGPVSASALAVKIFLLGSTAAAAVIFQPFVEKTFVRFQSRSSEKITLVFILLLTLLTAKAAEILGMHSVFGAFVTGILFSGAAQASEKFHKKLLYLVSHFFAPLFFASVGLKINFTFHFNFLLVAGIFVTACIGKITGVTAGGILSGLPRKESFALGFAMNARGAMGMVLAATALEYGMIRGDLFAALVLMALGTSIMSAPAIHALLLKKP